MSVAMLLTTACASGASGEFAHEDGRKDPSCALSSLGEVVHAAAIASPQREHSVAAESILTYHNLADHALLRGQEIFGTMGELIEAAEQTVNIAMFVWAVDTDPHDEVLSALTALEARLRQEGRHGAPVQVRLLANVILLGKDAAEVGAPLRASIDTLALDPDLVAVTVATRGHNGFDAMHHKLMVVDGVTAHLGGANVQAAHNWRSGAVPWHDGAFVVRGEVAATLDAEFAQRWDEGERWTCQGTACSSVGTSSISIPEPVAVESCTPMIALIKRAAALFNNRNDNPQNLGYLAAFGEAEHVIKVQSPNLNDDAARQALLDAVLAGVRVELLLSYRFNQAHSSLPGQGGGNEENVDILYNNAIAAAGQETACALLDARWYASDGVAVEGNVEGAAHLKYASFDDQLTIVGSTNMDTQSWNNSGEANVAIDDPLVTAQFDAKIFDPFFAAAVPSGHCSN